MKYSMLDVINQFVSSKDKVFGNYRIEGDTLNYRAQSSKDGPSWYGRLDEFHKAKTQIAAEIKKLDGRLMDSNNRSILLESLTEKSSSDVRIRYYETEIIAKKITNNTETFFIANSEILNLVGRTIAYGHVSKNRDETKIQECMRCHDFLMLPFSKFSISEIMQIEILDRDSNNGYMTPWLFKVKGKTYLIDSEKFKIDNTYNKGIDYRTYIIEVDAKCASIDNAKASLKPNAGVSYAGNLYFASENIKLPELTDKEKLIYFTQETNRSFQMRHLLGEKPSKEEILRVNKKVPDGCELHDNFGNKFDTELSIELNGNKYISGNLKINGNQLHRFNDWVKVIQGRGTQV